MIIFYHSQTFSSTLIEKESTLNDLENEMETEEIDFSDDILKDWFENYE